MKNDLSEFEKNLLKIINITYHQDYKWYHLKEWNSSLDKIKWNLKPEELLYENILGVHVAINPNISKPTK